ncbi:MAG: hypothetical protein WC527_08700 [Candidatus Margulisiibacteriota bacterium]
MMPSINRWLFGFFLAVLWPSVFTLCAEEPSRDAAPSRDIASSASEGTVSESGGAVQKTQQEVRDPFAMLPLPPCVETPKAPDVEATVNIPEIKVELQGIGFGSKDAYAVIGDDVFYNGDEKKGIKLLEVRRREVDILVNGKKITVPLFQGEDLQKTRDRAKKKSTMEKISTNQPSGMSSSLSGRE